MNIVLTKSLAEKEFLTDVMEELEHARVKFPKQDIFITLAALTEEVGELNQAVLQINFEPHKGKTVEHVRREAVQVVTMALRVIFDAPLQGPNIGDVMQAEFPEFDLDRAQSDLETLAESGRKLDPHGFLPEGHFNRKED